MSDDNGDGGSSDDRDIERLVDGMTPAEKAGQLVMSLPRYLSPDERRAILEEHGVGSVILRTPSSPAQAAAFTNRLQEYAAETRLGLPLLVGGDFAYGTMASLPLQNTAALQSETADGSHGATAFPQSMGLGATRSPEHAATAARVTARELRSIGVHWNFAPNADVNTDPRNPVIGVRSFGERPELVSSFVATQVEAFQGERGTENVLATAKHFPGHGDATTDSHTGLPVVSYDAETLEEVHLPPFEAAIDAGVDAVMTAHIVTEAIDPDLPGTLSEPVLTGLLRERLEHGGIVVTDSMDMDAIEERWGRGEAAVRAVAAGADLVLAVSKGENAFAEQVATVEALAEAIRAGRLSESRVNTSVHRILDAKRRYGLFDERNRYVDALSATRTTGTREHRTTAAEIGRESITLVKNDGALPFPDESGETVLVAGATTNAATIGAAVEAASDAEALAWHADSRDPTAAEIERAVDLARVVDRVLVTTWSGRGTARLPEGQIALVEALAATDRPVAAIAEELPYDVAAHADANASLAAYAGVHEGKSEHLRAAVEVVFGAEPGGRLPVTVEGHYPYGHGLDYGAESG